jgi:hypothetical protein
MHDNELFHQITKFLANRRVKQLCRTYHAEPDEAMGELYLRLFKLAIGKQINKPDDWTFQNGMGQLRNWLRREVRPLH